MHPRCALRTPGPGVVLALATAAVLAGPPAAHAAGADDGVSGPVDRFWGSFRDSVEIEAPSFFGIGPELALTYSSSGGDGPVGVGWSLSGFSEIERAGPGRGAPRYDSTDVFLLDGQELVPCVAGSVSPSCTTGGTHSTKIENYNRITFDGAASTWTVWTGDGKRAVYGGVYGTGVGMVFRWGLRQVIDTSGNTVTYNWWCDPGANCYPRSVSYGGAAIDLYYEARPDVTTFATGRSLGRTAYRLSTIKVAMAGALVRAYELDYGTSSNSTRSLLTAVRQHGDDAVVDGNGVFTAAGTLMPARTFSYGHGGFAFSGSLGWPTGGYHSIDRDGRGVQQDGGVEYADFNGDGITDLVWSMWECTGWYGEGCQAHTQILLGTGTGYVAGPGWPTAGYVSIDEGGQNAQQDGGVRLVDMNGDGKTDIVWSLQECSGWYGPSCEAHNEIWISTGSGFVRGPGWPTAGFLSIQKPNDGNAPQVDGGVRLADLNGDGKVDIVWSMWECSNWYDPSPATPICGAHNEIWLGTGSGFVPGAAWPTAGYLSIDRDGRGAQQDGGVRLVDMNGDGKDDVVWSMWECSDWYGAGCQAGKEIWLSTGTGFTRGPAWPTGGFLSIQPPNDGNAPQVDGGVRLVDMNGDGITDVVWSLWECSNWYDASPATPTCEAHNEIWLGTGNGFVRGPAWPTGGYLSIDRDGRGAQQDGGVRLVDLNHDGKTDVVWSMQECSEWYGAGCQTFNQTWLNTGNGFRAGPGLPTGGFISMQMPNDAAAPQVDGGVRLVDLNGDGVTDVVWSLWECSNWYDPSPATPVCAAHNEIRLGTAGGDVMTQVGNGLGSTTTVTYAPSTRWPATNNPPVINTVASRTLNDGRGSAYTTSYTYSGGLYDRVERRFLGFRYVRTTLPRLANEGAAPAIDTWFKQDYGSVSKPEQVQNLDGAGRVLNAVVNVYATNGAAVPYTSRQTQRWSYVYDGTGATCATWPCASARRTVTTFGHDTYGNVTATYDYGDHDVGGDQRTTVTTFVPNPAAYLVRLPAVTDVFFGLGTGGTRLAQSLISYDGAATWNQAPTRGLPTSTARWLNTDGSFLVDTATYDGRGNLATSTDATGATTTYGYDATYHRFLTRTTNPAGHVTSATWDLGCEAESTVTDANGAITTNTYDPLCRLTGTTSPLGAYRTTHYVGLGNAASQYVEVRTPGPGAAGDQWTRTWIDGLGRTWRTESRGPSAGRSIRTDTTYDARGNVASMSLPYYADASPVWSTVTYDWLDHPIREVAPDGSDRTTSYGLTTITTTDELDRATVTTLDVFGRPVQLQQILGGVPTLTRYAYDARGNLASVTDALGNVMRATYDSLGRITEQTDPDAGRWTFTYDAAGRMSTRTDARAQRTDFTYDVLGRIRTRTEGAQAAGWKRSQWTYDEPRAGFSNKGHLTSITGGITAAGGGALESTFDHDLLGRAVRTTQYIDGVAYGFQTAYDAGNRVLGTRYPDGDVIGVDPRDGTGTALGYDSAGRPTTIPAIVTGATYDAQGRMLTLNNANGTVTTRTWSSTRPWMTGLTTVKGTTTLQQATLTYNAVGLVTGVASPIAHAAWTYHYDDGYRLDSATDVHAGDVQTFTYDAIGRMTRNSRVGDYTYPATGAARPHGVKTAGPHTYSYDGNGYVLTGAGRSYDWDPLGRLRSVGGATFAYNALDQRVKKTVGGVVTHYVGDSYEVSAGVVTKHLGFGGILVARRTGTTTAWLHPDHRGSTEVVTSGSGAVLERIAYRPHGDRIAAGAPDEARGWLGQRQDETGLFHLHARYFDPTIGLFVSPDPLGGFTGQGMNRYNYAAGDPINNHDVSGRKVTVRKSRAIAQNGDNVINTWLASFKVPRETRALAKELLAGLPPETPKFVRKVIRALSHKTLTGSLITDTDRHLIIASVGTSKRALVISTDGGIGIAKTSDFKINLARDLERARQAQFEANKAAWDKAVEDAYDSDIGFEVSFGFSFSFDLGGGSTGIAPGGSTYESGHGKDVRVTIDRELSRIADRHNAGLNVVGMANNGGAFGEDGFLFSKLAGNATMQGFATLHDVQAAIAEHQSNGGALYTLTNTVTAIVGAVTSSLSNSPQAGAFAASAIWAAAGFDVSAYTLAGKEVP